MSLMRPFSDIRDQMERVFNEMETQFPMIEEFKPLGVRDRSHRAWFPAVDITETDKQFKIKVEVPGIKPEDLKLEILDDLVILRGESKEETVEEKKNIYRQECHIGRLYRRIPLPGTVKQEAQKAELKHGVLYLNLDKLEDKKGTPVQIQVK